MALGIPWLLVCVPGLQEAVFVSDSAKVVAVWTSQGASEATVEKKSLMTLICIFNHVFPGLSLRTLFTVVTVDDLYFLKVSLIFRPYFLCLSFYLATTFPQHHQ